MRRRFTAGSNNGNWTPAYQVFGADGFANITSGPNALRTTLYTFFWATSNVWPQFQFETSVKMNNFIGGPIARISAADSEAFHDILMARCKAWGCIGIETDFLDFNGLSFPSGLQVRPAAPARRPHTRSPATGTSQPSPAHPLPVPSVCL